jgi:hypothetical protein
LFEGAANRTDTVSPPSQCVSAASAWGYSLHEFEVNGVAAGDSGGAP